MRTISILAILLGLTLSTAAQQPAPHSDATAEAQAQIRALETKLADLMVQGDWDEYAKHLASDYVHTRDNGQVESREEALANLRDVKRRIIVMEMEPDPVIHIYDATAVANAEFTIRVREMGQVRSRRIRQTNVFVNRDGQWWLVEQQETSISK
jgi:ketosteroid isomerase-like protein